MKVLSLFDGIGCGKLALDRVGIPVEVYDAYEIDPNPIAVCKHNHPMVNHKGDVFDAKYSRGGYNLLIGGSPCTSWAICKAGKKVNVGERETKPEGIGWNLFMQYVRALKEVQPEYFLYENNASISKEIQDAISEQLGVKPVLIDSADFSAQTRKRLYWTNIPVLPYEKNPVTFADIMDDKYELSRSIKQYADTIKWSQDGMQVKWDTSGKGYYSQQNRAKLPNQKFNTVVSGRAECKNNVWLGNNMIRSITISELEKLQTLPVGYTSCLKSKEMRGKCIGNGWTVDVIAHIFKGLRKENTNENT